MIDIEACRNRIVRADCLRALRRLPSDSVDAIVADPPAGIAFMGKAWDSDRGGRDRWIAWLAERLAECYRIAKPGACALIWAIPRTSHWTGMAIEDAGWRIEDRVAHLFGSGFPKHKSKLKPACEDWWLAIKPAGRAVALNIDGCRIEGGERPLIDAIAKVNASEWGTFQGSRSAGTTTTGRWPANVVLSHHPDCTDAVCVSDCPVRMLDEQSGERGDFIKSGTYKHKRKAAIGGVYGDLSEGIYEHHGDSGGASRFFYTAKAPRWERNSGLEGMPENRSGTMQDDAYRWEHDGKGNKINLDTRSANHHPTVKALDLMRWLIRLIVAPDPDRRPIVTDPFAGSGSTLLAAKAEGFDYFGVESDRQSWRIATARLAAPIVAADGTILKKRSGTHSYPLFDSLDE